MKNSINDTRRNMLISTAISALTAGMLAGPTMAAEKSGLVFCAEQEKCFGVARAGKNDCATSTSSCAGSAKQDGQKDAWVYVPKGSCQKLSGGSLTSVAAGEKTKTR
jgi:uncharacterized membrane protein